MDFLGTFFGRAPSPQPCFHSPPSSSLSSALPLALPSSSEGSVPTPNESPDEAAPALGPPAASRAVLGFVGDRGSDRPSSWHSEH